MPAAAYVSVVPRLFALEPVRALVLVGRQADGVRLAESIYLRRLRSLGLRRSDLPADALATLVGSPMLAALDRLEIEDQVLDVRAIDAIGRTVIRELSLRRTCVDLGTLVHTPVASRLEVLVLDDTAITDDGALVLVRAPTLQALRRLSLGGIALGDAARATLVERFGAVVEL